MKKVQTDIQVHFIGERETKAKTFTTTEKGFSLAASSLASEVSA